MIVKGKEKILVTYNKPYKCNLGRYVKIIGKIKEPNNNRVFYQFNYKKYLLSKKIHYIFHANKIIDYKHKIQIKYKIKNSLIKYINTFKSKNYLNSMILGTNNYIEENVMQSYRTNGLTHLLSISGTHVTIFSFIIIYILNKIFKKKYYQYLILIPLLVFYLFLTNYSPALLRAVLFFLLKKLNLKISNIWILIFLFLILLNINPYYIYNLGFILSFLITLTILANITIIKRYKNYIVKTLVVSVLAFISSTPIIINNFHEINLLSPILNVVFVPYITLLIYPLCLLTLIVKKLDKILYLLSHIMEVASLQINKIKTFNIILCHLNIFGILIYLLAIIYILYEWSKHKKIKIYLFLFLIVIHHNINIINPTKKVTTIDVSQGDSILLKLNNEKGNILIDTGGNINNNISKSTIIPYLKSEGIKKIHFLIISHGDHDHMGEAINLVNNFKVEKVILNCGPYNDLEKELIKVLDKKKIKHYSCIKELNINENKLHFLQTKKHDNENDNSNVIYTKLDGYKLMFMGDASITTEKEIINKYNLPDIDVLKVGHHGSNTSSSKAFIDNINPNYSIISVGKNNRYGHPNKEVLENLSKSKIYRTDQDGSIMFKIKNKKLKIETCSP